MPTGIAPKNESSDVVEHNEELKQEKGEYGLGQSDSPDKDLINQDAYNGENYEHSLTTWVAAKAYPWACFWAFVMCFTIVMESFDMFLNGNFVALPIFQETYGVQTADGKWSIQAKWQSALFQAGQCGAFVGVFLAGPVTTRLGYRWTTILALILMNATIFICFFANSLSILSRRAIVPLALRGATTAIIQMSWSIGSIIVAAVTYSYNKRNDQWAWRVPLALQWIFPSPLLILIFLSPESPWWLIRNNQREEALKSVKRLGNGDAEQAEKSLAMIERTVQIERQMGGEPTLLDLFKGTDLRRTIITCLIYASQNLAGNLIANQATYFFQQAGMSTDRAFQLNLINSCLQIVANGFSLPLSSWFGRRTIYLWGTAANVCLLLLLGVVASVPDQNQATNYAQVVLAILISFVFAGCMGPISYAIISETSSVRLRALSTAVGRAAYYVVEIPAIALASQMLNATGWNMAGKCGYVWGGTALFCWVLAYFELPELKHRSYRESDILFNRKVPAREFKTTVIDVTENE
ncbi:maltose permease [Coniochaeta sp. 2T2.1]|nr:maltose permease [Coniochaeta sp. 2T2.1]